MKARGVNYGLNLGKLFEGRAKIEEMKALLFYQGCEDRTGVTVGVYGI